MIGSLRGKVLHKSPGQVTIDVQGVGYEVSVALAAYDRLPVEGDEVLLYICESMGMYGGGITLYGFLAPDEKDLYLLLKEIPGTGAKKALDYLDKIAKSSPDFRRAVLESDSRSLISLFGFTKKTADKIIVALKDKMAGVRPTGTEKWSSALQPQGMAEALAALVHLGYRESEARSALDRLPATVRREGSTTDLVREALKQLG
ncbi:MAG TPA: Holliday junction branch migration protein RuvA [Elusimicrobiota bacterium]|nr:Holliday junction branch migration protein RuvA [Elusimicrobiota bacterium]